MFCCLCISGDNMKNSHKKILLVEIISVIAFLISIILTKYNPDIRLSIFLLAVILFSLIFFCGYEKNNHPFQKDTVMTIVILMMTYYLLIYLLGIKIGFVKSIYSISFINIIKNILPLIIIIVLEELIRYEIVTKGEENKLVVISQVFVFILINSVFFMSSYDFTETIEIIKFFGVVIIPSLFQTIMLSYVSYKFGYKVSIIYRLFMELPIYILPIFPDLGYYLKSIFEIVIPMVFLYIVYFSFEKRKIKLDFSNKKKNAVYIVLILIFITIIILNSGYFHYYTLTIGSSSMEPKIKKGDIIIVEKYEDKVTAKEGEVIVYKHNGKTVAHRLIKTAMIDKEKYYYTKGDANYSNDGYVLKDNDIIGTVKFRIRFLGYPTIWLKEKIGGE